MDSQGFVFEEAPAFSDDTFPKYFGLIKAAGCPNGLVFGYFMPGVRHVTAIAAGSTIGERDLVVLRPCPPDALPPDGGRGGAAAERRTTSKTQT